MATIDKVSGVVKAERLAQIRFGTLLPLLITLVTWASAFAAIRVGLEAYSPEHVALLRYLTASAALAIYALATRMPLPALRDLPAIAVTGFFGFSVYNVALNAGEVGVSAGAASLIVASAPIFVAIMAGVFLSERLNRRAWLGILVSFAGVGVISFAAEDGFQLSPSAILVLVAAIAQSLYVIIQKPYLQRYNPLQFVTYAVWLGTAFLLIFTPGLIDSIAAAPPDATLAVVYMGVFPGAIGYVCWSIVLSRMPVSKAGSFLYLVPALAILIAWLWLGEIPSVIALGGGVLVLLGVILVNTRRRKSTL